MRPWRIGALHGDPEPCRRVLELALDLFEGGRLCRWKGSADLWLHGQVLVTLRSDRFEWGLLAPRSDVRDRRPLATLLRDAGVEVATAIHCARTPWSDEHARFWRAVNEAGVVSRAALLDVSGASPREADALAREVSARAAEPGLPGGDLRVFRVDLDAAWRVWNRSSTGEFARLRAGRLCEVSVLPIAAQVEHWDASEPVAEPRDALPSALGRALRCGACGLAVSDPVTLATRDELAALRAHNAAWRETQERARQEGAEIPTMPGFRGEVLDAGFVPRGLCVRAESLPGVPDGSLLIERFALEGTDYIDAACAWENGVSPAGAAHNIGCTAGHPIGWHWDAGTRPGGEAFTALDPALVR